MCLAQTTDRAGLFTNPVPRVTKPAPNSHEPSGKPHLSQRFAEQRTHSSQGRFQSWDPYASNLLVGTEHCTNSGKSKITFSETTFKSPSNGLQKETSAIDLSYAWTQRASSLLELAVTFLINPSKRAAVYKRPVYNEFFRGRVNF